MHYIFTDYVKSDTAFQKFLAEKELTPENIMDDIKNDDGLLSDIMFFEKYDSVFQYFDDWIVVKTNRNEDEIIEFVVKKKEKKHKETYEGYLCNMSCLTEFNEDVYVKGIREEGYEEAVNKLIDAVKSLRSGKTPEQLIDEGCDKRVLERALRIV